MHADAAQRPRPTVHAPAGRSPRPDTERRRRTGELFEESAHPSSDRRRSELLDAIVVLNVPMARSIAGRYRGRGCELEDLEQTACLALVRTVQRFDVSRGQDFLSYAVPSISGELKRHFRDFGWMVRPPRSVQELQPRVKAEAARQVESTGRPPDVAHIAQRLGTSTVAVRAAMEADGCFSVVSLDRCVRGVDGTTLAGGLAHPTDSGFDAADARIMLAVGLAELSGRHRAVIHLRFVDDLSQSEIADALGISQSRVSRLLHDALGQLRGCMSVQQG